MLSADLADNQTQIQSICLNINIIIILHLIGITINILLLFEN